MDPLVLSEIENDEIIEGCATLPVSLCIHRGNMLLPKRYPVQSLGDFITSLALMSEAAELWIGTTNFPGTQTKRRMKITLACLRDFFIEYLKGEVASNILKHLNAPSLSSLTCFQPRPLKSRAIIPWGAIGELVSEHTHPMFL